MIFNIHELLDKIYSFYFKSKTYSLYNDTALTYQEFCLIRNAEAMYELGLTELDTDKLYNLEFEWYFFCVAHFNNNTIIDKPWDLVLVDRIKESLKNRTRVKNPWYKNEEYKDLVIDRKSIFDAKEMHHKIAKLYYLIDSNYIISEDPSLTYQEFCLIKNVAFCKLKTDNRIDMDDLDSFKYVWHSEYVASYHKPMIFEKPWEEVLIDRSNDLNIKLIKNWKNKSPYKELIEKKAEQKD